MYGRECLGFRTAEDEPAVRGEPHDEVAPPGLVVPLGPVLAPVAAAGLLALPGGGDQDARDEEQVGGLPRLDAGLRALRPGRPGVGGRTVVQGLEIVCGGDETGGGTQDAGPRVMIRWIVVRASGASSGEGAGPVSRSVSRSATRVAAFVTGAAASVARGRSSTMSAAMRSAKTRPSRSELDASRFAPCTPVQATSPHAYSPGTVVRPRRSVRMPPEA